MYRQKLYVFIDCCYVLCKYCREKIIKEPCEWLSDQCAKIVLFINLIVLISHSKLGDKDALINKCS